MENKPISLLIVEDTKLDRDNFTKALASRKDINLIAMTDSDIEALKIVRFKQPDVVILDIELHNSTSGNPDSFEFLKTIGSNQFEHKPLIFVTTYLKSDKTFSLIHTLGADLILYKDHRSYSAQYVLNKINTYLTFEPVDTIEQIKDATDELDQKISDQIYHELDLIGISPKLIGRTYIHDAVSYIIKHKNDEPQPIGAIPYLVQMHGKSSTAITNGIQNSIIRAWKFSSIDDLIEHYPSKVNHETCLPTPMDFIYTYVNKITKLL